MEKLILFISILIMTGQSIKANNTDTDKESNAILEWVYWDAFSETFIKTADKLKAESAALEAENEAEKIVNAEEWLKDISRENNLNRDHKNT